MKHWTENKKYTVQERQHNHTAYRNALDVCTLRLCVRVGFRARSAALASSFNGTKKIQRPVLFNINRTL